MKLTNVLLGAATLLVGLNSFSQDDQNRECDRMRFLGSEAIKVGNYQEAAMYYLKGETICGNFDAKQYGILSGSLSNVVTSETDKVKKKAYMDTLSDLYNRMEEKGFYDQKDDLFRGYVILNSSKADPKEADELFSRGIAAQGTATQEYYLTYYYYNLYVMWTTAKEEQKGELKKRLITEYFNLSKLISEANHPAKVIESIQIYFDKVVKDCDDILPDLKEFMSSFPQDPELKKTSVGIFIKLLDEKGCTSSKEYIQLIDTMIVLDPQSMETMMLKAKALESNGNYRDAIKAWQDVKSASSDDAVKQEATYHIAFGQFKMHSYAAAYQTAMSVSGEFRGKALNIAGNSVGANADNCGDSTFDRNCNYIYAVQLLQQAKALGVSDNGSISKFTAKFPTPQDCFDNGNPSSVTLNCYGVSVSPCN